MGDGVKGSRCVGGEGGRAEVSAPNEGLDLVPWGMEKGQECAGRAIGAGQAQQLLKSVCRGRRRPDWPARPAQQQPMKSVRRGEAPAGPWGPARPVTIMARGLQALDAPTRRANHPLRQTLEPRGVGSHWTPLLLSVRGWYGVRSPRVVHIDHYPLPGRLM
jgi:hypothetical protein